MKNRLLSKIRMVARICLRGGAPPAQPVSPRNSDFIPYISQAVRPDVVTVLDVGCGKLWDENPPSEDYLLTIFSAPRYKVTGIDVFPECIVWRKIHGPPGEYLCLDALDAPAQLGRRFDLVVAHHVIEHLDKEASRELVEDLESLALKQVIIGAPVGFTNTDYAVQLHGNERERHKCGWLPEEFTSRGYTVLRIYGGAFLVEKSLH